MKPLQAYTHHSYTNHFCNDIHIENRLLNLATEKKRNKTEITTRNNFPVTASVGFIRLSRIRANVYLVLYSVHV